MHCSCRLGVGCFVVRVGNAGCTAVIVTTTGVVDVSAGHYSVPADGEKKDQAACNAGFDKLVRLLIEEQADLNVQV